MERVAVWQAVDKWNKLGNGNIKLIVTDDWDEVKKYFYKKSETVLCYSVIGINAVTVFDAQIQSIDIAKSPGLSLHLLFFLPPSLSPTVRLPLSVSFSDRSRSGRGGQI